MPKSNKLRVDALDTLNVMHDRVESLVNRSRFLEESGFDVENTFIHLETVLSSIEDALNEI